MAYSKDLRMRVIAYIRGGGSKVDAAERYGVSRSRIYVWLGQKVDAPRLKPGPKARRKVDVVHLQRILEATPDARLSELSRQFGVHESTISRALGDLGYSRKKNVAL